MLISLLILLLIGVIEIALCCWLIDLLPIPIPSSAPNVKAWFKLIVALIIVLVLLQRTGLFAGGPLLR